MYFTTDWPAAKVSVQRLADLQPAVAFTGHGQPMTNPRLAHDLRMLADRFDELAVPKQGRYLQYAARANKGGVISVPPGEQGRSPTAYLLGAFVAGFAAATALQISKNLSYTRRRERHLAELRQRRFREEAPVSYHVFRAAEKAKQTAVNTGRRMKQWWEEHARP
jgi:hypothetical protein